MAPVKRRLPARSHRRMKLHRRNPDIPQLVYKYLQAASYNCEHARQLSRSDPEESLHSGNIGSMVNRQRKDGTGNPKSRGMKRHRSSRDHVSSRVHKCTGAEGIKKVKKYIQEAINFGVEFGYLQPKNASHKLFRVSSDLINDRVQRAGSLERERSPHCAPTDFENYQVQDASRRRRRRRRRGRSRSGSRSRRRRSRRGGRKRSRSINPEEAMENEGNNDDYLEESDEKQSVHSEDADKNSENARLNKPSHEKPSGNQEEENSTTSVDENETDEDEEKKGNDAAKS